MKKWLIFGFFVLLLGLGVWWFWSLGSLPAEAPAHLTVRILQGTVSIKRPADPLGSASGQWEKALDGEELYAGDAVRTGVGSAATIEFFGKGESRLAENSEVTLEQAAIQGGAGAVPGAPLNVQVNLAAGRVWSRVLRLLDLDASFDVHTDTVVATVRGTGFDLSTHATGTTLWVSDSAVQISNKQQVGSISPADNQFVLSEGFMASFDATGKLVTTQAIGEDAKQSDWFIQNSNHDAAFVRQAKADLSSRIDQLGMIQPDSIGDGFAKLSERIHLAFAGNSASDMYARYTVRRLAAIKRLVDGGKSGFGLQSLASLQEDISSHLSGADGDSYRESLKLHLPDIVMLLQGEAPSSALYRLKQRLEDLNISLAGKDPLEVAYARLLAVDARLDEAAELVGQASLNDAQNVLDTARESMTNVERDIDHLPDDASADRLSALRGKLYGLKARETSIRTRLAAAIEPPATQVPSFPVTATSTTSTVETGPTVTTSTVSAVTSTTAYARLLFTVQPSSVTVGEIVRLTVKGITADGTSEDVTAKTIFTLAGNTGSLNGPTFRATVPGDIVIAASLGTGDAQQQVTAHVQVKKAIPVLQSVSLIAASTVLSGDATLPLTLQAEYSDGSHADVTASARISSSNTVLAYLTGNVLHGGTTANGVVRVLGTYVENGVQKTSYLDITIFSN